MSDKIAHIFAAAWFLLFAGALSAFGIQYIPETFYAREACTLLADQSSPRTAGLLKKGDKVTVMMPAVSTSEPCLPSGMCMVCTVKGKTAYMFKKHLCKDREEALGRYMPEKYDVLHNSVKDSFNGGKASGCDFWPNEKPSFPDNVMPEACYSLYITSNEALLKKIDSYIELARQTKINTFVIDIKEDGLPGFKADAMRRYCPTAYRRASAKGEEIYRNAVAKLRKAGFWTVGRIVVFKDCHITKDHPECGLWDKEKDCLLLHNKSHWPSAYSRFVWEYNVSLAIESVEKIGFNEINFDYVRFPDRMNKIEPGIQMRNTWSESKVQAIQRFVSYAAEQIHRHHAYLSVDVFGESANPGYTTAYGQYWPAISNIADVICGMPYPDHFSKGYYGIAKPWNSPYEILYQWGKRVNARQEATPSPARVRTWIQAYHVMRHVDPEGIDYDAENVEKEIRGLYEAGLTGGYCTWLSNASLERYTRQKAAFSIDYLSEYRHKGSGR